MEKDSTKLTPEQIKALSHLSRIMGYCSGILAGVFFWDDSTERSFMKKCTEYAATEIRESSIKLYDLLYAGFLDNNNENG